MTWKLFPLILLALIFVGCKATDGVVNGWVRSPPGISLTLQAQDNALDIDEGGSASVLILATTPAQRDTQYSWTIQNADARFSAQSGSGTLPEGQRSFSINFSIARDSTYQADTTATLQVSGPDISAPISITLHVHDTTPTLSIADVSVAENVSGAVATLTVVTSNTSTQAITFDWATSNGSAVAGSDYTVSNGTGLIAANTNSTTFTVPIANDATNCEGDENFYVTLSNVSSNAVISDNVAIVTIQDDDGPTLSLAADSVLPGVTAVMTSTLSTTCASDITFNYATVNGTAVAGSDYTTTSGSATITAGQTATTINVPTASQSLASSKTFSLNLSNVTSKASPTSTSVTATIAAPSMDLDLTSTLPASVTFSRASIGTYYDSDRILRTATADTPRFEHDPVTGQALGLLIEDTQTNLMPYSQGFDSSSWTTTQLTATPNMALAPDGTLTADKLVESTSNSQHIIRQTVSATASSFYTYSVFLKKAERSLAYVYVNDATDINNRAEMTVDLNSGSIVSAAALHGNFTVVSGELLPLKDGWYRATLTFKTGPSLTQLHPRLYLLDATSANTYTGDGTSGIFAWGAQLEPGQSATSYIPTGRLAVVRAADTARVTDLSWFNTNQGVLVAEAMSSGLMSTTGTTTLIETMVSLEADANNRIQLRRAPSSDTGTESALHYVGGAIQFNHGGPSTGWAPRTIRKQALGYGSSMGSHAYEGTAVQSASGIATFTPTQLSLGSGYAISALNGSLAHVSYFGKFLNSDSMQQLTTRGSAPVLYIEDATATEGNNLTFTVRLSSSLSTPLTVNWAASSDSAILATDTTGSTSGSVTIPSGSTSATFSIATASDSVIENSEALSVSLSSVPSSVIAGDTSAIGTIRDTTLDFDFTSYPLTSGISIPAELNFRRTSLGTYFNSSGVLKEASANFLSQSESFELSPWIATSDVTPDSNQSKDPGAMNRADFLSEKTVNGAHGVYQDVSVSAGAVSTCSVYAKSTNRYVYLRLGDTAGTNLHYARFDILTGAMGTSGSQGSATLLATSMTSVGSGWYRVSISGKVDNAATTVRCTIAIDYRTTGGSGISYLGDGKSGIFVWGAQFETGSSVTPYIPTTVGLSYAPRYDYDPVTHVARGLLMEAASTNLVTNSSQFGSSPWSVSGGSVTQDSALAPDGTMSADTLAQDTSIHSHRVATTANTYSPGTYVTGSVFAKAGSNRYIRLKLYSDAGGSDFVEGSFDLSAGTVVSATSGGLGSDASASIANIGNGWYRISTTGAPSSSGTTVYMLVGHSNTSTGDLSTLYIWGAQLEQKRASTSYIPTTTAAVTRNSDFLYANTADWFSASNWTALISFSREHWEPVGAAAVPTLIRFNSTADPAERIRTEYSSDNQRFDSKVTSGGSSTGSSLGASGGTWNSNQVYKVGMTKNGSNITQVDNGTVRATGAISTVPQVDVLYLGGGVAGGSDVHLRTFYYFPRVLTNTQLQDLTN